MSRIASTFHDLKARQRKAFVAYVMAGFPNTRQDEALALSFLSAGADLLEIGVPFSDPLADGPVIQRCGELALTAGGGLRRALELARALRPKTQAPLVLMTYCNPPLSMGIEAFAAAAAKAGVDGCIIPDLSPEEAVPWGKALAARGLSLVLLAAPTSTPERLAKVAAEASGFVYFVSVAGVTGFNQGMDSHLATALAVWRKASSAPAVIGFGINSPQRARQAAALADGVVAATALLKPVLESGDFKAAAGMAKALAKAVHSARG
jgi:tryptophan synthase alpha chain